MKKLDYLVCFLLALITLASRVPFIEKFQSHWDGPQYTIAVIQFSYEHFTPSPPGYPFFIGVGKFFYLFLHDPHKAILAACVFGSVLGGIILYMVGRSMYNRYVGIVASTIFLTGSTFYYFALTPYGFSLLFGFEILVAYWIYRIYILKKQEGLLYGLVVGTCLGIRPQELLQIAPFILFGLYYLRKKERIKMICMVFLTTLVWLLPIVYSTGIQKFLRLSYDHLLLSLVNNSFLVHVELITKGFLLSFGISAGFLVYYFRQYFKRKKIEKKYKKFVIFYLMWILPGFLYNLLIRTEHAGYQMSYLTGFVLLIAYAVWKTTEKKKFLFFLAVIAIATFNLYWFFYNRDPFFTKPYRPTSFHYSDIRKNDIRIGSKMVFVQKYFSPKNTLLISTEAMFRPYSYYLKTYHQVALNALDNTDTPYIYHKYTTYNWNMTQTDEKKFSFVIPDNITTILFIDDKAYQWIKNYPYKKYNLPANGNITSVSIPKNIKIIYDYHSIKFVSNL